MNNCSIIVLGATGDLTKRKIMPALYNLVQEKKLDKFIFVGAAFDHTTPHELIATGKKFVKDGGSKVWKTIEDVTYYQQLDFQKIDGFTKLETLLNEAEKNHGLSGNRLVYCASPSEFFCEIAQYLGESGVVKKTDNKPWHRIIFEKPFGHDLQSAQDINACIAQWFNEHQIYRVDHYLTKELISNIALVRFTNTMFEPLWNSDYIDSVSFVCSEEVGIEDRGSYYDSYGVLSDFVQSHMLQMLALISMEAPSSLLGDVIRNHKAKALADVKAVEGFLGQYKGYTDEKDVATDSQTPTFALIRMGIDNKRWKDVPFYFVTGKHLDKKETFIKIVFKNVVCALQESAQCRPNILTIRVYPEAGFSLTLNAKDPENPQKTIQVPMEFCHSCEYPFAPKSYQVLLQEVMAGEQSIGVRFDEIEQAWRIMKQIKELNMELHAYKKGSRGPEKALTFAKKRNLSW